MISGTTLRLDRLSMRNFRCFAECAIELDPELTVLVAENGHGKTAALDAISIALGLLVESVSGMATRADFDQTDVRLVPGANGAMNPSLPAEVVAAGIIAGQPIHWRRTRKRHGLQSRTTTKGAEDLLTVAQQLRESVEGAPVDGSEDLPILPLVACYGTERHWNEHRLNEKRRVYESRDAGRMSGYSGCLTSSSSFTGAADWYGATMSEIRDPRFPAHPAIGLIGAVREAARVVLEPSGWCKLDWDFERRLLIDEHSDQGRMPLSALSDGVRSTVALVTDIARRCATLNPHLGDEAAQRTPGVLLIDEVDLHLHPSWQQQVVDLLRKAFPAIQMVLSTHSPHVLTTVDRKSIRTVRLRDGEGLLNIPRFQTRGVESADVLATIMGVDPVPQVEEARWLNNYRALIQGYLFDSAEAKALRARLEVHFGDDHPVILECDRMIRLEQFKRTLPSPPNQKRD